MASGSGSDDGFYSPTPNGLRRSESGEQTGPANIGAGPPIEENARKLGESSENFQDTPPAQKRRGRPLGSLNRTRAATDALGTSGPVEDIDRKIIEATAATIKGNHLMFAMATGLPMPMDDKEIKTLAIAWINFKRQFPAVEISPKMQAILGLTAAGSINYGPVFMAGMMKLRNAVVVKRQTKPGFNIPPVNPQDRPQPTNGATPPQARQPSVNGEEFVLTSGVPDKGKIDFGG